MEWIKNEGKVFTPPTNKLVHIKLSTNKQGNIDGDILYNQKPYKWDWLKQSGVEITHYCIVD